MTLMENLSHDLAAAGERLAARRAVTRGRTRITGLVAGGALALGGVSAAATTLWQPQLGDDRRGHPTASATPPPADQLARFGVLRRDAVDADRGVQSRYALRFLDPGLKGVRTESVRLVGAHDGDGGYVLVPVAADHGKHDSLCLFARDTDGGGLGCWTTGEILTGKAVMGMGRGPTAPPPGAPVVTTPNGTHAVRGGPLSPGPITWFGIVPDGVSRIQLDNDAGSVTVAVHDNFFSVKEPSTSPGARPGGPPTIHWLDDDGREVGP